MPISPFDDPPKPVTRPRRRKLQAASRVRGVDRPFATRYGPVGHVRRRIAGATTVAHDRVGNAMAAIGRDGGLYAGWVASGVASSDSSNALKSGALLFESSTQSSIR